MNIRKWLIEQPINYLLNIGKLLDFIPCFLTIETPNLYYLYTLNILLDPDDLFLSKVCLNHLLIFFRIFLVSSRPRFFYFKLKWFYLFCSVCKLSFVNFQMHINCLVRDVFCSHILNWFHWLCRKFSHIEDMGKRFYRNRI